jgi:hypothetical protein
MSIAVQPCDISAVAFREDDSYRKFLEIILLTKEGLTIRFGIPKDEWKKVIDKLIEYHDYTEILPEGFGCLSGETEL